MATAATLTPRFDRAFLLFNALLSSAAVALIAFILLRERTSAGGPDLAFMPVVNAVCNGLSALCLVLGFVAIRRRSVQVHRVCMVSAFTLSAVFLMGYLAYHSVHRDTKFIGTGPLRFVYFFILITHVVLSVSVVPLALTSFYFAFTRAFGAVHRADRRVPRSQWREDAGQRRDNHRRPWLCPPTDEHKRSWMLARTLGRPLCCGWAASSSSEQVGELARAAMFGAR